MVARITPPTSSGSASPAPVFGMVSPSTLELLSGAGDVVDGDADALGEAEADPVGKRPGPAEPEGEADGEAEPDGLGDVCALDRVPAVAADDINMSKPVINDNIARTASTRGIVLRIRPPFCIPFMPARWAAAYARNSRVFPAKIRQIWKDVPLLPTLCQEVS